MLCHGPYIHDIDRIRDGAKIGQRDNWHTPSSLIQRCFDGPYSFDTEALEGFLGIQGYWPNT